MSNPQYLGLIAALIWVGAAAEREEQASALYAWTAFLLVVAALAWSGGNRWVW
jgi:hypothetical protein